ncbi:transglutaminase-like domain-containing protein [Cryptosporangium sp. NPDC051539]|uniref:transglutaminase-like domain-containing protein n=1 Tax=Cryptosporangium sp. NPDC051539 TaxID=3363962 RepID=UPI00379DD4A7
MDSSIVAIWHRLSCPASGRRQRDPPYAGTSERGRPGSQSCRRFGRQSSAGPKLGRVPIDYATPGPFTTLDGVPAAALEPIASSPVDICRPVHGLVVQPGDAEASGLPADRLGEKNLRPAASIAALLLELDPAPLSATREPLTRVVGTCRHYAVLACALLRSRGIPARARCGFATYFRPGQGLDHWITEYHDDDRWVRVDAEAMRWTPATSRAARCC